MTKWYQLRVTGAELSPEQTFMCYQIEKRELFISPHLKLAGFDKTGKKPGNSNRAIACNRF